MRSFYHFAMPYRGIQQKDDERRQLAEAMFHDHDFPKQSVDYDEISQHFEMNSPFPGAVQVFDRLWQEYEEHGS
ncbi:uncharacterized protein YozE (UPF0346 family) [Alkalibacillus flavidus]|uniref:Uncharacterized protein YozE (UPF0346 family) n=1 Tax=Alkalibacillus flavidus TaxID=546021 RepID=A0ABV2KUK3_9BACI